MGRMLPQDLKVGFLWVEWLPEGVGVGVLWVERLPEDLGVGVLWVERLPQDLEVGVLWVERQSKNTINCYINFLNTRIMEKLVKEIGFSTKNGSEHLNFHNESKVFMDNCGAENINCTTELDNYSIAIQAVKENMRRQQASAITPQMEAVDEGRDGLVLYAYSLLDAGLHAPVTAIQEAYGALHPVMQPYRGIGNKPVTQESADILAMLTELNVPALQPHIATLGMTSALEMLDAKNQEYIALDTQRLSEVPSKKETTAVRDNADTIYKNIVNRINATLTLSSNENAVTLKDNLNNLIDRTNAANKQRLAIVAKNNAEKKAKEAGM